MAPPARTSARGRGKRCPRIAIPDCSNPRPQSIVDAFICDERPRGCHGYSFDTDYPVTRQRIVEYDNVRDRRGGSSRRVIEYLSVQGPEPNLYPAPVDYDVIAVYIAATCARYGGASNPGVYPIACVLKGALICDARVVYLETIGTQSDLPGRGPTAQKDLGEAGDVRYHLKWIIDRKIGESRARGRVATARRCALPVLKVVI